MSVSTNPGATTLRACANCLELPQCRIDSGARPTRRQDRAQFLARRTCLDFTPRPVQRPGHVRDVIAHVVDAGRLAAAAMYAVAQRDHHDVCRFEAIAGNPERISQLQRFDGDVQRQPRHQ
jgi:hypothetical protein